jgi:hypothetical protein
LLGLEGGVENSSTGCNSSNFVNVTKTRIVGTTGIATYENKTVKMRLEFIRIQKLYYGQFPWYLNLS